LGLGSFSVTNPLVRAMINRMNGALIASLGVAFILAPNESFARSGGGARGAFASARPISRPVAGHGFRHHRGNGNVVWPGVGGDFYGSDGTPVSEVPAPPNSSDVHYTYTYEVPWDWAHRYPPAVAPSDRPYVPGCSAETVTVPGRGGQEQAVNVTRCY
jgi:hypothetical protein